MVIFLHWKTIKQQGQCQVRYKDNILYLLITILIVFLTFSDTLSTTRVLCGALLLPSISSLIGRLFFDNIKDNLHRTIFGGLAFIAIKGVFKIYFKQKQFVRKKQRKILDYTDDNVRKYVVNRQAPNFYHEQR